jgi:hypothetical protein
VDNASVHVFIPSRASVDSSCSLHCQCIVLNRVLICRRPLAVDQNASSPVDRLAVLLEGRPKHNPCIHRHPCDIRPVPVRVPHIILVTSRPTHVQWCVQTVAQVCGRHVEHVCVHTTPRILMTSVGGCSLCSRANARTHMQPATVRTSPVVPIDDRVPSRLTPSPPTAWLICSNT